MNLYFEKQVMNIWKLYILIFIMSYLVSNVSRARDDYSYLVQEKPTTSSNLTLVK